MKGSLVSRAFVESQFVHIVMREEAAVFKWSASPRRWGKRRGAGVSNGVGEIGYSSQMVSVVELGSERGGGDISSLVGRTSS